MPIRESDVAGLAAAKVIIDGAHQTLATNPSSMYGSCPLDTSTARAILCLSGVRVVDAELLSPVVCSMPSLVPPAHMATKSAGEWGILIETEVAKIKRMKMVHACYSSKTRDVVCVILMCCVSQKTTIQDDDNNILVQYLKLAKELPFYGLVRLYPPPHDSSLLQTRQVTQFIISCVQSVFRSVKLETSDLDLPDECIVGIGIPGLSIYDPASQ